MLALGSTKPRHGNQPLAQGLPDRALAMLELFSRTKIRRFFQTVNLDAEINHARVELVWRSIEWSLRTAQADQAALSTRLEDVTSRALVPLGNGTDEYLTRDDLDTRRLGQLEQEILQAEQSLERLASDIAHFEFLKTALKVRFPEFKPSDSH
jgi:hypothetical protein